MRWKGEAGGPTRGRDFKNKSHHSPKAEKRRKEVTRAFVKEGLQQMGFQEEESLP